ncbi:Inorganic phosphate transporter pho84 [Arthrobotrys musiformis]|uniref:Inorganic phosphate transporter pho84 n=1 Tax=Arthrobotrys musiformis TaxID=47236 RepID=A0AAV9VPR0_9PEZI
MWPQGYLSKQLTPVPEESSSGGSGSTRRKPATDSPQRGNSIEMEVRALINHLVNMTSQIGPGGNTNENIAATFIARRGPRFTGDGNDERDRERGIAPEQPADRRVIVPSPENRTRADDIEDHKYKIYRNYVYMAASMCTAVEGYVIFLPALISIFFGMSRWPWGADTSNRIYEPFEFHSWASIALKLSVFLGMMIGSILTASLFRKYDDKSLALGFLVLMFFASLAMVLSGSGPGIDIFPVMVFWRTLVGIGIGGCRSINALTSSRISSVKWRGARLGYVFGNLALGYCSVILVTTSTLWFFKSKLQGSFTCDEKCKEIMDKAWRVISGVLLLSIFLAMMARWKASTMATHPGSTSRVICAFSPSFWNFLKAYSDPIYLYQLVYISVVQFIAWACFYGALMNLPFIIYEAGYMYPRTEATNVADYISRIIGGVAIPVVAGMGVGYIVLCNCVDRGCGGGRKLYLTIVNICLAITTICAASTWSKASMGARMGLLTAWFGMLVAGPLGCAYVFTAEMFPRGYRVWTFMIVEVVGCFGATIGIVTAQFILPIRSRNKQFYLHVEEDISGVALFLYVSFSVLVVAAIPVIGLIDTGRKEVGVIEGEVYGDWGTWDGRRLGPGQEPIEGPPDFYEGPPNMRRV